jgi:transcriptional regulator with XRE-family HTH domain
MVEIFSAMKEKPTDLNQLLAARISQLRADSGLSLDALAERSGVSRSMISVVERGESNATAVVLDKLAAGLGVTLASLFDPPDPAQHSPLNRHAGQKQWKDPASGYRRRNLSPAGPQHTLQLIEVFFPPGARVAFEGPLRESRVEEQLWLLEGIMQITVGDEVHELYEGDCLALTLDHPVMFHNPGTAPARYLVAIVSAPSRS